MSLTLEKKEITVIVNRLLDNLSFTVAQVGETGFAVRNQIGKVRANFLPMLLNRTFADELLACFTTARAANASWASFVAVRNVLFAETPKGDISSSIVQLATVFCLTTESLIITKMEFVSRDDVDTTMRTMKDAFDTAREMAADALNSGVYQQLTYLAGALTNHLASTARPLPRMVKFSVTQTYPALTLSQLIYYDPVRYEEILAENKIIHPAFCPRVIMGLSK